MDSLGLLTEHGFSHTHPGHYGHHSIHRRHRRLGLDGLLYCALNDFGRMLVGQLVKDNERLVKPNFADTVSGLARLATEPSTK